MLSSIIFKIKERKLNKKWRKRNKHNFTIIKNLPDISLITVGNYTYGMINLMSASNKSKLKIGNFCSIANGVKFILNGDHELNNLSTYPFKVKLLNHKEEAITKGDIVVEDDVWIAENALILSGVHIGQGAVIGAGAVVTKDVPPYAVMGGVPARIIKYRFSEEIIKRLEKIDFTKLDKNFINSHINDLYKKIENTLDLSWFPFKSDESK